MFKDDFVWGVASSAYQIEGRDKEDGAGQNIWDVFTQEGRIKDGSNSYVACDHMHRYEEDFALMRTLGVKAYRFSMSWSRILPQGTGEVNQKGIQLYRNMILSMKKNGVEPYITMYHWEFPQALQDKGGWLNEDVIQWFGEYAKVVAENFSDICENFITLNEPECFVGIGYMQGVHAPALKLPYKDVFQIAHNALRAHGQAVINLRKYASGPIKVGYAPTCGMAYPLTESKEDIQAARKVLFGFYNPMNNWAWNVAWFNDPVFLGKYPQEGLEKFKEYLPEITDEDMKLISQPLDFMGQNIYNGYFVKAGKDGEPEFVDRPYGFPTTAAGWPITPGCFYWGVKYIYERYKLPMYITENGISCNDVVSLDGQVHDPERIDFLDRYISVLQKACDEGADVKGYFLWTFLDNFEWDKGYTERFGLVHVDFTTLKRTVKDSAYWYKKIMESNGRELSINKVEKEILFLEPVFKQMLWGGSKLRSEFGYSIPGDNTGECWAVSAHPHGDCKIKAGVFAGKSLSELWEQKPQLFGCQNKDRFPLLVKIIDAKSDLSIQVHPDDDYAGKNENGSLGKTECWYILDCEPDSSLVIGHNAKTREELKDMIQGKKWSEFIREIPVKKGDFIQINPGTVHAIKGGLMILETQQNSDITYRVYDYDRLSDGKPRELHVDKSIDVITVPAASAKDSIKDAVSLPVNTMNELIFCDYYSVYKCSVQGEFNFCQSHPFLIVSVIDGDGIINGTQIKKGDHFILPADYGMVKVMGRMELILSSL